MKVLKKIAMGLFVGALAVSCEEEEPPGLNLKPSLAVLDTTYVTATVPAAQPKGVLIEDFSGVRCVNCPQAHDIVNGLIAANPVRVSSLTIHPTGQTLTIPYSIAKGDAHESKYDFSTDEGKQLGQIGIVSSLPIGDVNRKLFPDITDGNRLVDRSKWAGYVSQELALPTPVNIDSATSATRSGNKVTVKIKLVYTANVTDTHFVSIALMESKLHDPQEGRNGSGAAYTIEDYDHERVFRKMITPVNGDMLKDKKDMVPLVPGRVFEKTYEYIIPPLDTNTPRAGIIDASNLSVVVFVHEGTGKTVLNARTFIVK